MIDVTAVEKTVMMTFETLLQKLAPNVKR